MSTAFFYVFATLAVLSALTMVTRRNPLSSALALVATLGALSGVYALLAAEMLALVQILVYAGAVTVLILFVVMVVDLDESALRTQAPRPVALLGGGLIGAAIAVGLCRVFLALAPLPAATLPDGMGSPKAIGRVLLGAPGPAGFQPGPLLFPFEVVSLLLLVAVAGAVVLAKKRL